MTALNARIVLIRDSGKFLIRKAQITPASFAAMNVDIGNLIQSTENDKNYEFQKRD